MESIEADIYVVRIYPLFNRTSFFYSSFSIYGVRYGQSPGTLEWQGYLAGIPVVYPV